MLHKLFSIAICFMFALHFRWFFCCLKLFSFIDKMLYMSSLRNIGGAQATYPCAKEKSTRVAQKRANMAEFECLFHVDYFARRNHISLLNARSNVQNWKVNNFSFSAGSSLQGQSHFIYCKHFCKYFRLCFAAFSTQEQETCVLICARK